MEAHTGGAREDEVVGSKGLDLVVGEEGREEATMDREGKVVGSLGKSRESGWIFGSGAIPMEMVESGGGGDGTRREFLGLSKID